jgi:hypothetical protein
LNTTSITTNSATINWTSPINASTFTVEYKLSTDANWQLFASAQVGTGVNLTGLTSNSIYNWRVRVTCNAGIGDYIESSFTTLPACETPTELTTTSNTGSSTILNWTTVANAINYRVEYKLSSSNTWILFNDALTVRLVTITNLTNASSYNWSVSARCNAGLGNATSANFTTICQSRYDSSANRTLAGAALIPFNIGIRGSINAAGDVDNYKIVISKAGRITISLTNLPTNYNLQLLHSASSQLAISQKNGTSNESISYTVAVATYYVRVYGAATNSFNTAVCYLLNVNSGKAGKTIDGIASSSADQAATTVEVIPTKSVLIYPNPVKDKLNIKLTGIAGISEFIIYNSNGEKMMSAKTNNANTDLDLRSLKPGYYTIKVINQNKIESSLKIIKL